MFRRYFATLVGLGRTKYFYSLMPADTLVEEKTELSSELLAAYAELHKLEHLKAAFVGRVSHELRTPLAVSAMACHLIGPRLEGEIERAAFARLEASLERLRASIEDILLFSSLQQQLPIEARPVDVVPLLKGIAARHADEAARRRVSVTVDAASSCILLCDEALIGKALEHLLTNAVRFSRPGGAVRLEARYEHGATIRFFDSGQPIPGSERALIFDSFYQAAEHLTRQVGGLGLGLAIVRRAVEAHRGRVDVESLADGNVFTVWLPSR